VCLGSHQKRFSESFPTQRLLCCMEICPPEKLTNVSHFISWGLFCNYQKDVAARRAATSMFWFKENQRPVPLILRGIISRWAPSSENDTSAYIANVSRLTGITPDEPIGIPSDQPARWMMLGAAMAIQENGTSSLDYFAMLRGWELARSEK